MTRLCTPAVYITRRMPRTRRLALEVLRCVAVGVSCRPLQANIQLVGQGLGLMIPIFRRLRDSNFARMDHGHGKDSHHLGYTRRVTDERTMELESIITEIESDKFIILIVCGSCGRLQDASALALAAVHSQQNKKANEGSNSMWPIPCSIDIHLETTTQHVTAILNHPAIPRISVNNAWISFHTSPHIEKLSLSAPMSSFPCFICTRGD